MSFYHEYRNTPVLRKFFFGIISTPGTGKNPFAEHYSI